MQKSRRHHRVSTLHHTCFSFAPRILGVFPTGYRSLDIYSLSFDETVTETQHHLPAFHASAPHQDSTAYAWHHAVATMHRRLTRQGVRRHRAVLRAMRTFLLRHPSTALLSSPLLRSIMQQSAIPRNQELGSSKDHRGTYTSGTS